MKKITSLLMTVALLATMISAFAMTASAEEQTIDGTNITWELSEDGKTLTFTGEGAMPDYDIPTFEGRPWHSAAETVTAVQINPGITTLGDYAFYQFKKMTSVTIPDGVTSIGKDAFDHCESLTRVTIPYGVTGISGGMFFGCTNLTSVTIPSSVASIDQSAFWRCTNLQSVTIPSSVVSIGDKAFYGCTSLQSVTIPSSVMSIDSSAFNGCSQLASVTVKASTPPTLGKTAFNRTSGKLAIYVPCGLGERYQQAGGWSEYKSKIKEAYVVDDQPAGKGKIMLDKDCFPKETYTAPNQTVTVTVMPAGGYQLKADSLFVVAENGEAIALTQDETDPMKYTFTMPCSNVTVKAEFEKITDETETGSTLSDGNLWIIAAVAVIALGGVATLVIIKKKTALAGGNNTDEE